MSNNPRTDSANTGPEHATLFIWIFSVSSIWHYTSSGTEIASYLLQFNSQVTPLIYLSIATAMVAALFPNRTWALLTFSAGQLIAIGFRYPQVADHLVMELFLNLSIVVSFAYLAVRKKSTQVTTGEIFELFSPIGRWLLIIMYFFGTFHKINPGFMSLESSCAVPFIAAFPLPDSMLQGEWIQWTAIYGTLILEFLAMLLLFSSRGKYVGMLIGMSFHFFIGISGYGTLAHFSAFAMALHTLFLPSGFGNRLVKDALIPPLFKTPENFRAFTVALLILLVSSGLHLGITRQGFFVNSLFALFGLVLLALVLRHGQMRQDDAPYRLRSAFAGANIIPIWFFLHCLSPYVGLGTGGTIQMFSGLRTEGGISNHYIIREPLRLFPYQDTIVYIEDTHNVSLKNAQKEGQGLLLFDFQRHFVTRESLALPITLRINDVLYSITDVDSLVQFAEQHFTEQSWLEQKYMSFRLVDEPHPDRCRH
jgi:hypothetical protein